MRPPSYLDERFIQPAPSIYAQIETRVIAGRRSLAFPIDTGASATTILDPDMERLGASWNSLGAPGGRAGPVSITRFESTYMAHGTHTCLRSDMANVTVTVPEDLKKKMGKVPDVNWSEVARQAFEETIRQKQMREAAEAIDKLRESSPSPGWSGAREIRKWRDTRRKP